MNNQFPVEESAGPLSDLGYTGAVRLTGGPLADRLSNAAQVYGGLSLDSVLKGFRERAGLPAPGEGLKGWSRETTEPTFGQWVSGLARLSRVLGDRALADTRGGPGRGVRGHAARQRQRPGWASTAGRSWSAGWWTWPPTPATKRGPDPAVQDRPGRESSTRPAGYRPGTTSAGQGPGLHAGVVHAAGEPVQGLPGQRGRGPGRVRPAAGTTTPTGTRFADPPRRPGQSWDVPVWLHAYSHVNTLASAAAVYDV